MKFAPRFALTVAIVGLGSSFFCSPVHSAESESMAPANRLVIDKRLADLNNRIKRAQTEGRLTSEEADNLKSALGQIIEAKAEYLRFATDLGPAMTARLATSLNRLEKNFDVNQHDRKVAVADLAAAEALTGELIKQALEDKRLTASEAEQLDEELKSVQDLKTNLSRDGAFTYGDSLVISMHLDRVVTHLGKMLDEQAFNAPAADTLASDVSTMLSTGKLDAQQSAEFRKEYDNLVAQLTKAKETKNSTQVAQQQLFLASQFELLKNKVELAAAGKTTAVAVKEREKEVDKAIADALLNGSLTPAEAHELRAELEGTSAQLGGGLELSAEKQLRAALELARIESMIKRTEHTPSVDWPGFKVTRENFGKTVDAALAAGRISAEQAQAYKGAAESIVALEDKYRTADGGIGAQEALDLAMRIEQLEIKLHRESKDRQNIVASAADIDALQKELDHLIADGVESGKVRGVSRWNERLAQIAEIKANFEKTPAGLDTRAKLDIAAGLADAIVDVQAQLHRDTPTESSLDLRLGQLNDRISNAVACGVLPVERGAQYRAGVDTILNQLWAARRSDGGLSASESLTVASDVNLLTGQLDQELRGLAMPAADVTGKINALRLKIGKAVAGGRLPLAQADRLVNDTNHLAAAINAAASSEGGISYGEGLKFAYDTSRLNAHFETLLHNDPLPVPDISHRARLLDRRLANALAAGQLTVPQAQQYKFALDRVLSSSAVYRDTDAGLSYPESLALSVEMDSLGNWISRGLQTQGQAQANKDIDSREADIHSQVKNLLEGGKLSQADARAIRYELDRIEESESAFRVSEEGLNYAEALTLTLDLDRLNARLSSLLKSASNIRQEKQQ